MIRTADFADQRTVAHNQGGGVSPFAQGRRDWRLEIGDFVHSMQLAGVCQQFGNVKPRASHAPNRR